MIRTNVLSKTELFMAEQRQCAHTDANATKFAFQKNWTHKEVDRYIKQYIFPCPMDYVSGCSKGKGKDPTCYWKLLNKEKQQYELAVTRGLPTGADLFRYRGREKCAVSDSGIIIGMTIGLITVNY